MSEKKVVAKKTTKAKKVVTKTTTADSKISKTRATSKKEIDNKLRIIVKAYEPKVLDLSVKQIIDTANRFDAIIRGPVPLPIEIAKYTVNRSAFVYKNAREQFEIRVHKRIIDILNPNPKLIEALTNLSLPSGVDINVKMG